MARNNPKAKLAEAGNRWRLGSFVDSLRFKSLRGLERVLPPTALRWALWPWIAVWVLLGWSQWKAFQPRWNRIPPSIRKCDLGLLCFLRRRLRIALARFLTFWPDRLGAPRWQKRIRYEGMTHLQAALESGSPAVLATLHFSTLFLLRYLLRARQVAASVLVEEQRSQRSRLQKMKDALMASPGLPAVFTLQDLREARRFLTPGHCLIVAVDMGRGKQMLVPTPHGTMRLATGAMRLAQAAGAWLIPCLVEEEAGWRYAVHFGKPVPPKSELGIEGAGRHLVGEFLPILSRQPTLWGQNLINSWQIASEDSIPSPVEEIMP